MMTTANSQSITLPSPAKLNLFLHINGKLPNGYHELQSLFHFVDYGDELTFTVTEDEAIKLFSKHSDISGYHTAEFTDCLTTRL